MDVHRFPWSAGYAHLDPIGDIYPFFSIFNCEWWRCPQHVHNISIFFRQIQ